MSCLLKRKLTPLGGRRRELTDDEQSVYGVIRSRENMCILKAELKREVKGMKDRVFNASVKSLIAKNKVKEEKSMQNKKVYLMSTEFQASTELTGGTWYSEGNLDKEFVDALSQYCLRLIGDYKILSADQLRELVMKSTIFKVELNAAHIMEILKTLILDKLIVQVKSTGSGLCESIPIGTDCYKCARKAKTREGASSSSSANKVDAISTHAMVSMPCGSCPRINDCTPDGAISPLTCDYYNKWLDF